MSVIPVRFRFPILVLLLLALSCGPRPGGEESPFPGSPTATQTPATGSPSPQATKAPGEAGLPDVFTKGESPSGRVLLVHRNQRFSFSYPAAWQASAGDGDVLALRFGKIHARVWGFGYSKGSTVEAELKKAITPLVQGQYQVKLTSQASKVMGGEPGMIQTYDLADWSTGKPRMRMLVYGVKEGPTGLVVFVFWTSVKDAATLRQHGDAMVATLEFGVPLPSTGSPAAASPEAPATPGAEASPGGEAPASPGGEAPASPASPGGEAPASPGPPAGAPGSPAPASPAAGAPSPPAPR